MFEHFFNRRKSKPEPIPEYLIFDPCRLPEGYCFFDYGNYGLIGGIVVEDFDICYFVLWSDGHYTFEYNLVPPIYFN